MPNWRTVSPEFFSWVRTRRLLGTLSKDDDDGSKNAGKKMNLRSFKLNRVYLDPLKVSNAGDFSWSWILKDFFQVQKEVGMSKSSIKRQIRRFHVVVVQWTSKKCAKKRNARAELLFWSLNLLLFWSRRCGRRSCLSSLLLTRSRLVWLMHQRNTRSQESFSLILNATFQNTVYTKTNDAFPKIQAWAYNRYSSLHRSRLRKY